MELSETVRRRRMVRRFDPGSPVAARALAAVLDAMCRAPSAGFSQGTDLVVLEGPDDRAAYWSAALGRPVEAVPVTDGDTWLRGVSSAPVLVLLVADPSAYERRYGAADKRAGAARGAGDFTVPWWDVDAGMAAQLGLLAAVDQGLGALFFGVPPQAWADVRAALGIPAGRRLVGVLALGHPSAPKPSPTDGSAGEGAPSPRRRQRRSPDDVVHRGRW